MTYRMLTEQTEIDALLVPILEKNGSEIPTAGCYIAAVQFDDEGSVVAYQMLQNAVFLEGMWARDHSANLRSLYNMATHYAVSNLGAEPAMTMTRNDATGQRIGKLAERLGFEKMNWNVFRRKH